MAFYLPAKANASKNEFCKNKKLDMNHECILEAIQRKKRIVKIKNGFKIVKKYLEKAFFKNEETLFLTPRGYKKAALEHWLDKTH